MKHTTGGFSIILALGLMLILSLTGLYLLEYMVPFSRNVKGIENASKAFYQSYGALEDSIMKTYSGARVSRGYEPTAMSFPSSPVGSSYSVVSSGGVIPFPGRGDSEFDSNWNQLSLTQPISIYVGKNRLNPGGASSVRLRLRIPDLDKSGDATGEDLLGIDNDFVIWQLSSQTGSITAASGSLISENDINGTNIVLWSESGTPLSGPNLTFGAFYGANCNTALQECVLKVSVINPLVSSSDDTSIPYLEYQLDSNSVLPFQESYVRVGGKSYGFSKKLEVVLPHRTTSSAFDFTVLQ